MYRSPLQHAPLAQPALVRIERLPAEADDAVIAALTSMLHRAYRPQVEMGLMPLAGRQSDDITRRRCLSGETYVARVFDGEGADARLRPVGEGAAPASAVAGMILFEEVEDAAFPPWFLRPDVAHFSLFAVAPELQGHGIGAMLLATVEERSRELGRRELALSMAEPDEPLMRYYLKRGFRFIQHWRWPYTNYRSAILSRSLAPASGTVPIGSGSPDATLGADALTAPGSPRPGPPPRP